MAIESVSSSSNVAAQVQARDTVDQARQQAAVQAAERRRSETDALQASAQTEVPEPKPVVNAEGQTTGRVISTSA